MAIDPPITIETVLNGRECNLLLIAADFFPKVGDTIWVRHEPFEGSCFHVLINEIKGDKFIVEEV